MPELFTNRRSLQPLLMKSLEVIHVGLSKRQGDGSILTMQMRHLYRSPLRICFSSSLIRAFRASMVVAVDSSSVTLGEREEKEKKKRGGEMFTTHITRRTDGYEAVC